MLSRFSADRLFWVAAGLAAVGGAIPFLTGGPSSRIAGVFIPYAVGAIALGACAVLHDRGRAITGGLYFVAGLALVFGMLSMFALPLQLAVQETCFAPPAPCAAGLQRPLTISESTGIGIATGFAFIALFVGYVGLMIVFHRHAVAPPAPPVRSIPPVTSTRQTKPVANTQVKPATENGAEPAMEEPELELPPHVEEDRPELPPHESKPPTT